VDPPTREYLFPLSVPISCKKSIVHIPIYIHKFDIYIYVTDNCTFRHSSIDFREANLIYTTPLPPFPHRMISTNTTPTAIKKSHLGYRIRPQRYQATDVNTTTTRARHHLTMIYTMQQILLVNASITVRSEVTIECNILWFMNIIRSLGCQNIVYWYQLL